MLMPSVGLGDHAPDFDRPNQRGEVVSLRAYQGHRVVVLYFYPKDNTLICTREACGFRDAYADFASVGAIVIGVSGDTVEQHVAFTAKHALPFHLLSDADGALRQLYGVPKTLGIFPGRVTYVIDKQGIVRHVFNAQFTADRHVSEALQVVRELIIEPSE